MKLSEWTKAHRVLSPESCPEPGEWQPERLAYLDEIMDSCTDPTVHTVAMMTSAQVGKSTIIENLIGYHIDNDPCPMLLVQPTLEKAEDFSKERIAPMLRDTPVLHGKVKDPRSRDSGNTLLKKQFLAGYLAMAGANSPAGLASRPVPKVMGDEIDRWLASAGGEGDPMTIVDRRTTAFWNRLRLWVSTPGDDETSRIKREYERGDQRKRFCPCPHCGHLQVLHFRPDEDGRGGLRWATNEDGKADPLTTRYYCDECDQPWTDGQKDDSVLRGEWRPTAEGQPGVRSYWLWQLYSPFVAMADMVATWLDAKDYPDTLKVQVNTVLAETWKGPPSAVDELGLMLRAEDYDPTVALPGGVVFLTAGVDVQDNRLVVEIVGWVPGLETYSIDYRTLLGDPAQSPVWAELDQFLLTKYPHPSGASLPISSVCIDSGGHHTQKVYEFCGPRWGRRIWAVRGSSEGASRPIVPPKASAANAAKCPVFTLGVHQAKDLLRGRLRVEQHGPGYCHFRADYSREFFEGLAAEHRVIRYNRSGTPTASWVKFPGRRNEPWDCRVYATCAYEMAPPDLTMLAESLEQHAKRQGPEGEGVRPKRAKPATQPLRGLGEERSGQRPARGATMGRRIRFGLG